MPKIVWEEPPKPWWSRWWAKLFGSYDRGEAMRRLGGPDVNAEQRKKAMNGEQKMWVLIMAMIMSLMAWGFLLYQQQQIETAHMRPTTDQIVTCVNSCARSCAAESAE